MEDEAAHLVVARFMKPHGLRGDVLVYPMTDDPEEVFAPGRVLRPVSQDGVVEGDALVVDRSRPYQRHWLLSFAGVETRSEVESWPQCYLGAATADLRAPGDDEMYLHELPGSDVVEDGVSIGTVRELMGGAGQQYLVIDRDGRECLIPFCEPIVTRIDRQARRIEVALPPGLLEL